MKAILSPAYPFEKGEQCVVLQSCRANFFIEVEPHCSAGLALTPLPVPIGVRKPARHFRVSGPHENPGLPDAVPASSAGFFH